MIGYVGLDNEGLGGIEAAFDSVINGRPGTALIQTDARRHAFSRTERPPTTGATVQLTIDQVLQWIAERELKAGVAREPREGRHRDHHGSVDGRNPGHGERAYVQPQRVRDALDKDLLKNRAVQDIYEPGSTFKIVTASAALQEKLVKPTDIDRRRARARSRSARARRSRDMHRYGVLSFEDVIVKSSNVGAIKVGFRVGAERLGATSRRFGFGSGCSPDFRGESPGIVWSRVERQRPGVGVDGLSDRRHAAADGHGRQLGRERRPVDGAAPGARDRPGRTAHARAAEGAARDDQRRDRGRADDDHGRRRRARHREGGADRRVHDCREDRDRCEARATARTRSPTTWRRSSGSCRRGSRSSPSSWSSTRRTARATPAALSPAPIFKRIAEAAIRHLGVPRVAQPRSRRCSSGARARSRRSPPREDASTTSSRPSCRSTRTHARHARAQRARRGRRLVALRPAAAHDRQGLRRRPAAGDGRLARAGEPVRAVAGACAADVAAGSRGRSRDDWPSCSARSGTTRRRPRRTRCREAVGRMAAAGVVYDSRKAAPGTVFVAVRGQHADGNAFTQQAVARGAAVVVTEEPPRADVPAPEGAGRRRAARAGVARRRATSVTRAAICRSSGSPARTARPRRRTCCGPPSRPRATDAGLLGTVTYSLGDEEREATRTTPEAPDMQAMLREMADRGCRAAVMEVSSHALALRRVDGIAVRGRRVHQSDPRPSRFPPRHGGLRDRQAPAVRDAARRAPRASSTRTIRAAPCSSRRHGSR